ncbi:MAG: L,D-transpeptidase [Rhizobiales bacterium]|nr:L,D-transpeptidase [Hyphomicrobiales bacterium]
MNWCPGGPLGGGTLWRRGGARSQKGLIGMRNLLLAMGIASLLTASAAQAAIVRQWDPTQNKWVTYDTKSPAFFRGSSKSGIAKEYVTYAGPYGPRTIVINTAERRLYYIYAPGKAIKYGIGVGREGFTWAGTDVVAMKAEWPGWTPPPEMIAREKKNGRILPAFMPGGLNNPLGARALYIGARIYRIHGSNEPWTIGQAVSSGCIRMTNDDVIDLYNRVPVGTRVVVLSNGPTSSKVDKGATDASVDAMTVIPLQQMKKIPPKSPAKAKVVVPVSASADALDRQPTSTVSTLPAGGPR